MPDCKLIIKKAFNCTICGKIFKRIIYLDEHIRIHTNERPFKCEICGLHFKTKSPLYSHMVKIKDFHVNYVINDILAIGR